MDSTMSNAPSLRPLSKLNKLFLGTLFAALVGGGAFAAEQTTPFTLNIDGSLTFNKPNVGSFDGGDGVGSDIALASVKKSGMFLGSGIPSLGNNIESYGYGYGYGYDTSSPTVTLPISIMEQLDGFKYDDTTHTKPVHQRINDIGKIIDGKPSIDVPSDNVTDRIESAKDAVDDTSSNMMEAIDKVKNKLNTSTQNILQRIGQTSDTAATYNTVNGYALDASVASVYRDIYQKICGNDDWGIQNDASSNLVKVAHLIADRLFK
jgi:hypothetical protein